MHLNSFVQSLLPWMSGEQTWTLLNVAFRQSGVNGMSILVFPFTPFLLDNNQVITTVSNGHFSHYALYL